MSSVSGLGTTTVNPYVPTVTTGTPGTGAPVSSGISSGTPTPGTGNVQGTQTGPTPDLTNSKSVSIPEGRALMNALTNLLSGKTTLDELLTVPDSAVNQLAKIIIMQAAAASRATLDQARNQADSAIAELLSQAKNLRKEASDMMSGAIGSLVMTLVSSAVTILGAAAQFKALGRDDLETSIKASTAGAYNQATQGVSQIFSGLSNLISTYYQAQAKEDEAQGSEDAAQSQQLNSQSQVSQKFSEDLAKLVDQLVSLLKEIRDAEAQMMQTMTRV